ncbi:23S rRNA (adenine(2030)-N(6))-methyltransferase RlmJ [Granulibacter bethesdensis]|uniref:23S rRNA (adenine(2030)-N(6))-methyltransferase RlmJ n=1 Tax=Granulibacter bethesdensis TaxID=364410 RepID=UPI00090C72EF|nr:23S rRNA (adenine(2030)-N(6))-methyltransferase RlmJ [Granulibacter bethesdensis]APH60786.1 Hypothetical protein GbCGDNIH7_2426 [Granulibacter bethesdensis]
MNYRHAFHAGNFADCHKHALMVALLTALRQKEAPFFVLDTHAGTGETLLTDGPAARTGEWREGIGLLLDDPAPALASYLALVTSLGMERSLYPGSPLIARAMLRPQDRMAVCELHPEDGASLAERFRGDPYCAIHRRDGWKALETMLPPKTASSGGILPRRGLTLIDPPFEQPDEHRRLADAMLRAQQRFPTGMVAGWYPIKGGAPARLLRHQLQDAGLKRVMIAELFLRPPTDTTRLNGSGMAILNPPWQFGDDARAIMQALKTGLKACEIRVDEFGTDCAPSAPGAMEHKTQ